MNATPRLSLGLPVYNGERYLETSLDTLLGQSFGDFELIISDNTSTDGTPEICHRYAMSDSRIRYFRQPRNRGLAANHTFVADRARGELFKWASCDDLYAQDLLQACVDALDAQPEAVLAHSWTATIDSSATITEARGYPLSTSSPRVPERFSSLLFDRGGDDIYGVIRTSVLRRALPHRSHHHADRTIVAEISLYGPFCQVPDWLYFRRIHPEQAEQACTNMRSRCVNMDPGRASRLRHPAARLYGEYVWAYVAAIRHAPLSPEDRHECYRNLARWMAHRSHPGGSRRDGDGDGDGAVRGTAPVDAVASDGGTWAS